jgi:hypothetical protein
VFFESMYEDRLVKCHGRGAGCSPVTLSTRDMLRKNDQRERERPSWRQGTISATILRDVLISLRSHDHPSPATRPGWTTALGKKCILRRQLTPRKIRITVRSKRTLRSCTYATCQLLSVHGSIWVDWASGECLSAEKT